MAIRKCDGCGKYRNNVMPAGNRPLCGPCIDRVGADIAPGRRVIQWRASRTNGYDGTVSSMADGGTTAIIDHPLIKPGETGKIVMPVADLLVVRDN